MDNLWSFLNRNKIRWTRISRIAPEERYMVYLQSGGSFGWEYGLPEDIFAGGSGLQHIPHDEAWRLDAAGLYRPSPKAEEILGIQS